ncbi:MAG: tetratricopeptide repeat protein, partial [Anaerolineales bacterium]|nr:tetratricopeptide repeat protein [Anaerolineales bacterium]
QRIYRETQGNPLFIVAILQNLFEEGVLYVNEEGEWATEYDESTVDYAELMLPPTIREVIEARLVRLDEGGRRILALASVLGQNFALDLLQRVSGRTEEKLFEVLDDLMRRHLIQEESRARGYRFDHPKVREVIYAGLDAPQRAALHRRVGEVLEEQHPGDLQAVAERLAHHFRLAAEAPKTVEYSIMAGQEALWMCAHQEASEHFRQALASAEEASLSLTPAQQLAIQQGLGEAHWMAGRYDQARACYEEAMSYADAETAAECEALLFKAFYLDAQRGAPISSLLRRAKAFESKLEEVQDPLAKAHHWLQKGYALLIQGVADQARECYHRGWEIISNLASTGEEGRYTSDLAEAHRALGEAHLWWGDYERGARDLERALSLYQETGDVLAIMRSRLLLGELLVRSGAWGPALANLSQVVETATRVEHPPLLGEALIRLAHVHTDQGDWGSAEAEALRGQAIAQEVGDLRCQGGAQLLLNRILIKRGEAGQALPSCQAMEAMIRASGSGLYLCLALRYLSEAYVSLGEPEKALVHCREGLELACAAGSKREIGAIQRIWGEALVQQGRWDEAEARLQASVELLERAGIPYELGESRRSLGKLYRERGAAKAARQHLDAALALFENLGAKHDAAVTRQLISDLECLLWPGPACRQAGLAQRVGGEERPTGEG